MSTMYSLIPMFINVLYKGDSREIKAFPLQLIVSQRQQA